LPLWLAPSQWNPLLPVLSEHYCTITLSGAEVGFVSVLETRGRSGYLRVVRSVLDEVPLQPGDNILEVGCGSGVLSRWLAHRTEKANPIVAMDLNPYLVHEAESLAAKEGLSGIIEFREGNAERLPFPDNRFHVTLAFTVMEEGHANQILTEMVRVTKPGGHIAVIVRGLDMPWLVNLELPEALKAKVEAPTGLRSVAQGGCADASLYHQIREAGLIERHTFPQLAALSGPMGYYYLDRLQAGLSAEEATVWRTAMSQAEAEETLFIAQPFHCAIGTKPR
jgi:SAM-dependent methyltransferase